MPKFIEVLKTVTRIYNDFGFEISTSLNSYHYGNNSEIFYTWLSKKQAPLFTGGGISIIEAYCIYTIINHYKPQNIFTIGNAFGFSNLIIALSNPEATVISIDAGVEGEDNDIGNKLTLDAARQNNINLEVIKGFSPQDVPFIVNSKLNGKIDLCFIDGLHTNEQLLLDYNAIENFCTKNCVILFHDIIHHHMLKAFEKIGISSNKYYRILHRTTSGMGIVYPGDTELEKIISIFDQDTALSQITLNLIDNNVGEFGVFEKLQRSYNKLEHSHKELERSLSQLTNTRSYKFMQYLRQNPKAEKIAALIYEILNKTLNIQ